MSLSYQLQSLTSTHRCWMSPSFLLCREHMVIFLRYSLFPRSSFLLNPQTYSSASFVLLLQFWQMVSFLLFACMLEYLIFSVLYPILVSEHGFQICQSETGISKYVFLEGLKSSIISLVLAQLLILYHEALLLSFFIFIKSYHYGWNVTKMSCLCRIQHLFTRSMTHLLAVT